MKKVVPQKNEFDNTAKWDKWLKRCSITILALSLLGIINNECINSSLISFMVYLFTIISAILTTVFQALFESSFRKAEDTRRDSLIDNAFSTRLADVESEGYFDTNSITPGIHKLLANIHENSFFSGKIISLMYCKMIFKTVLLLIIAIILVVLNIVCYDLTLIVINLLLSVDFSIGLYKLHRFKNDINTTQENCKSIATNINSLDSTARIIREVIRYETSLAYISIMFDSKVYEKINDSATSEWKGLMSRYYK